MRQYSTQVTGDTLHAVLVQVDHRRFSVKVGGALSFGTDDAVGMAEEIRIHRDVIPIVFGRLSQQLFVFREFLFADMLLQDEQVAACLRTCIFSKEVVGHAHGGEQVGLAQHQVAHGTVAVGIQHALWNKECDDTAVSHRVQRFQAEIIVYLLGCSPMHRRAFLELRIEHGNIAEGNV